MISTALRRLRTLQAQLALASIGVGLLLLNLIFLLLAWHLPAVRATLLIMHYCFLTVHVAVFILHTYLGGTSRKRKERNDA